MAKIIIIGAGGVGQVVAHKCAQMADVFDEIVLGQSHREQVQKNCRADSAELWPQY